jgi:MscS family membrane protein
VAIRWALSVWTLPLLARQFWASSASILFITAAVWLGFKLSGFAEARIRTHMMQRDRAGVISVLTLARWGVNLVLVIGGVLVALNHFRINPTTTLAGLGIGGVAVALAAQKTLENMVGGVSVVLDQAFRVGDVIKVGDTSGVVQDVGLRSTRIRTSDRTIVSVPNGQLATVTLENLSTRDTFWFHHVFRLDPSTKVSQLRSILDAVPALLVRHPSAVREPLRVHLQNVGALSLDIEVFSYLAAHNWDDFLRLQQDLLLEIIKIIENADAKLADPEPALYLVLPNCADAAAQPIAGRTLGTRKRR